MKSKNIWPIGLIIVLLASFINGLLIRNDITGLPREGMRLVVLIGIGVFIFGILAAAVGKSALMAFENPHFWR